jgi:membrane-associated phospholipid phosphatase
MRELATNRSLPVSYRHEKMLLVALGGWLLIFMPLVVGRLGGAPGFPAELFHLIGNVATLGGLLMSASVVVSLAVYRVMRVESPHLLVQRTLRTTGALTGMILLHQSVPWLDRLIGMPSHDVALFRLDTWLFLGHNPLVMLDGHGWLPLTYFLWLAYIAWFPLFAGLLYALALQDRQGAWAEAMLGTLMTFLLGFAGYVLYPAQGPLYTLAFRQDLLVGAPAKLMNGLVAGFGGFRDAFPSLHTAVAMIVLLYGWRFFPRRRWAIAALSISIMVATVYLRWHYVSDVLAGVLLAVAAYRIAAAASVR